MILLFITIYVYIKKELLERSVKEIFDLGFKSAKDGKSIHYDPFRNIIPKNNEEVEGEIATHSR